MDKEEQEILKKCFTAMQIADIYLREVAVSLSSKFDMDVPNINLQAISMIASTVNSITESVDFIKSLLRVSTLQQVVSKKVK